MIGIHNVSKDLKQFGTQYYEVRSTSGVVLAEFTHKREDGLARCLQLAGEAIEKRKWEDARRMMLEIETRALEAPRGGGHQNF